MIIIKMLAVYKYVFSLAKYLIERNIISLFVVSVKCLTVQSISNIIGNII